MSLDGKLTIVPVKDLKLIREVKDDNVMVLGLVESIKVEGLLHPPLIKDDLTVIAGDKRVRDCQILGFKEIVVRVYPSNLPDETYKILRLHENLKRFNLPWYDQVVMEKELHDLRVQENGKAETGKRKDRGGTGWGLRDTAQELNISFGGLSQDIKLAEAYLADPSMARIQDKKTAMRVITKDLKLISQENTANANTEESQILLGGSEEVLKAFSDNTFDACITDPPWLEFKDATLTKDKFTLPVFKEIFRVLKPNSFLFAFVSTQDWYIYQKNLEEIGFNVQKYPMIWIKENSLSYGTTTWQTQRNYEQIILAVKGSPAFRDNMILSTLISSVVNSGKLIHPNEKPVSILEKLISYATFENSLILDPFGGSGALGEACDNLNRRYVIIEKEPKYFVGIKQRLEKEKK
jgi:site-specific DNA-methyltransferase (adenine-specific)